MNKKIKMMMMSLMMIMIMSIIIPSIMGAVEICPQVITQPCILHTPALDSCNPYFDYYIINASGAIIEHKNLTYWSGNQYSINLSNKTLGVYMAKLCDNSTQQLFIANTLLAFPVIDDKLSVDFNIYTSNGLLILGFMLILWLVALFIANRLEYPVMDIITALLGLGLGLIICFKLSLFIGIPFIGIDLVLMLYMIHQHMK